MAAQAARKKATKTKAGKSVSKKLSARKKKAGKKPVRSVPVKTVKKTRKKTKEISAKKIVKKIAEKVVKKAVNKTASKVTRKVAAAVKPAPKKKRTKMTAAQKSERAARRRKVASLRKILLTRNDSLLAAYNAAKGNTRESSTDGTEDYIDYAVSSYDRDFMLSLTEMERGQLRLIEDALSRIDQGQYGNCMNCHQEIPLKRLEVEPWARYCIHCQELFEMGQLEEADLDDDEDDTLDGADDGGLGKKMGRDIGDEDDFESH